MAKSAYHDQWIREHYNPNIGIKAVLKEYNEAFGTVISYGAFVNHASKYLKLTQNIFHYTKEHDDFLKKYYPVIGGKQTVKLFNEHFKLNKSESAIIGRCAYTLGLKVTDDRKNKVHKNVHYLKGVEVGTISSGTYATPAIRTEDGW